MRDLIAAIDLGSNSFRLQVGRIVNDQIYPLDGLKEAVRLAAGLSPDKMLDLAAQQRGVSALRASTSACATFARGGARGGDQHPARGQERARVPDPQAEAALGFPIEVIAGREEARLIYVGVAHTLPNPHKQQLVVDIGGGSTEFIIGKSFEPIAAGIALHGLRRLQPALFPDGRSTSAACKEAELAARARCRPSSTPTARSAGRRRWVRAARPRPRRHPRAERAVRGGITRERPGALQGLLLRPAGGRAELEGLRPDRLPVLPGGFAIMRAVFKEFGLERMVFSEGALRLGVLYDLLGRYHHHDLRDATVRLRASATASTCARRSRWPRRRLPCCCSSTRRRPTRATRPALPALGGLLHEIGMSVAHSSYHKHSAYILGNADMPGFSRMDQGRLARIVLAHRGKLAGRRSTRAAPTGC
jgi:exopolyphosphatase/guanosine-5'-triphosphate,3'-diphosphate pyrophosphatase